MQPAKNNSKSKFIIIGGIAVAIVIIIGGAAYAFSQVSSSDEKTNTDTSSQSTEQPKSDKTVTQQTLNQGMNDLDETVTQSKEAHSEASAAIKDPSKRVKVSQ